MKKKLKFFYCFFKIQKQLILNTLDLLYVSHMILILYIKENFD